MGYRGPESSLLSNITSLWSHKRFHTAFFTDAVEFPDFPFEHTQCAGRECGVLLHSGLALQGLVDVDSVWRQGSSQCGKTTGHSLSTPNQLRAVDLREREVEEERRTRKRNTGERRWRQQVSKTYTVWQLQHSLQPQKENAGRLHRVRGKTPKRET